MILNPNCSELVKRLEIKLHVSKLNIAEILTLNSIISKQTTDFNYDTIEKEVVIYDYDSYYAMENELEKLPFWSLLEYSEHEYTEYC